MSGERGEYEDSEAARYDAEKARADKAEAEVERLTRERDEWSREKVALSHRLDAVNRTSDETLAMLHNIRDEQTPAIAARVERLSAALREIASGEPLLIRCREIARVAIEEGK